MGERDAAQAEALIRALNDLRDKYLARAAWFERHGTPADAAALRPDINEAQRHINRLRSSYPPAGTGLPNRPQQRRQL